MEAETFTDINADKRRGNKRREKGDENKSSL